MRNISLLAASFFLLAFLTPLQAGEVAFYTGATSWISKAAADEQTQISIDTLSDAGIATTLFSSPEDIDSLAAWVQEATANGELDVLVLYGLFPSSIYSPGNGMPDGSTEYYRRKRKEVQSNGKCGEI